MLRRKTVSVRAAAVAALCLVSANASAEQFWNTGNGDIFTAANYTDNLDLNTAYYNVGNTATVSLAATQSFNPGRLRIGHSGALFPGPATLNMTGGNLTPGGGNPGGTAIGSDAGLAIGLNGFGEMNVSGTSTVTVTRYVFVGSDNTSNNTGATPGGGTLNISGSTVFRSTNNDMVLGAGNPGAVAIGDSATLFVLPTVLSSTQNNDLTIGQTVASTFTMNGSAVVSVCNSIQVGSGSTFTMNGGTLTTRAKNASNGFSTFAANGNLSVGSSGTDSKFIMNAGTLNVGHQMTVGQNGSTNASFTIVSGSLTTETAVIPTPAPTPTPTISGNISVGTGTAVGAKMNIQGGTIVGNHRFLMGTTSGSTASSGTGHLTTQTGGSMSLDLNWVIGDTGGESTYNLSGGTLTANSELSRVGRQGTGTMLHSGTGVANFNSGLGIGDDAGVTTLTATGTYQISGGEMHATLAPASGAALRIGTAGTGTFRVVGDDGLVDVNGNFLLDRTAPTKVGTLAYRFEVGDSLSTIDVSGTATLNNLAAVTLDDSVTSPGATSYDLLTASKVIDNGIAFTAPAGWNYYVTSGGNGEVLRATQGTAPTVLYWDTDAATPGSGGASPAGNWDGATTSFTTSGTGISAATTAATTAADDVVFSAGADSTGSYTVTVSGTQAAGSVGVTRGNVTLTGGTLATGTLFVAPGASATVNSVASGNGSGAVTKTGTGTLTLGAANTMTSTTVSAGTLVAAHGDAFGGGSVNVADGAVAQAQAALPKAVTVTTLNTNASGKFDVTNNSMVIKGMADTAVRTQLQAGYNGGAWNGATGIVSSSVTPETSVGYATQAQVGVTDFKGVTGLVAGDVLVKYTYAGDANLDGKVDIGDLGLLAGAWQQATGKVWFDGDFTYDGAVDIGDLGLLSGNWQKGTAGNPNPPLMDFNTALAQFSAFDGVVVPEPTSLSVLALGGIGLLGRRRRGTR